MVHPTCDHGFFGDVRYIIYPTLKASTLLIDIPSDVWKIASGGIILVFGVFSLFPHAWEWISIRLHLGSASQGLLQKSGQTTSHWRSIALGAALGPVFSSCSPTYAIILALVLPSGLLLGVAHVLSYALGLGAMMLLIALLGQAFVKKLTWLADPMGWFKRGLGVLFILVGLTVLTGADKWIEAKLLDLGYDGVTQFELEFSKQFKSL
ncbi:sulfite exporter TauE/SafE family protein [Candidatus Peregrinibacteria bacterium]|nr:MAG: sulfite exporter TauE/SafE family protein [Candidatus Peregrinibacteria bacterium]